MTAVIVQIASAVGGFAVLALPVTAWVGRRLRKTHNASVTTIVNDRVNLARDVLVKQLDKQGDEIDSVKQLALDTSNSLQRLVNEQFGENHGGLRQTVDEIKAMVTEMGREQNTQGKAVARVEGRLDEHIRATGR